MDLGVRGAGTDAARHVLTPFGPDERVEAEISVQEAAEAILGMEIKGLTVEKVLITPAADIAEDGLQARELLVAAHLFNGRSRLDEVRYDEHFEVLDPDANPGRTQEYGVGVTRSVVVSAGDRQRLLLEPDEGQLDFLVALQHFQHCGQDPFARGT